MSRRSPGPNGVIWPAGRLPALVALAACLLALLACPAGRDSQAAALGTYLAALQAYEAGRLDDALVLAERARQEDSRLAPAWNLSGRIRYLRGELDLAAADLRRAVRERPSSIDNRVWLARAWQAVGDMEAASQVLDSVLADDGLNLEALRLQAGLAIDRSDLAAAMQLLERAANGLSAGALVLIDRASLLWAAGNGLAAQADLETARRLLPADSPLQAAASELAQRIAGAQAARP